jgi:hypothetical protein
MRALCSVAVATPRWPALGVCRVLRDRCWKFGCCDEWAGGTRLLVHLPAVNSAGSLGLKDVAAKASASLTLDRSAATYSGRGYCSGSTWGQHPYRDQHSTLAAGCACPRRLKTEGSNDMHRTCTVVSSSSCSMDRISPNEERPATL